MAKESWKGVLTAAYQKMHLQFPTAVVHSSDVRLGPQGTPSGCGHEDLHTGAQGSIEAALRAGHVRKGVVVATFDRSTARSLGEAKIWSLLLVN